MVFLVGGWFFFLWLVIVELGVWFGGIVGLLVVGWVVMSVLVFGVDGGRFGSSCDATASLGEVEI